ncbi:hypothetical protein FEM48_Zijuj06G0145000 [Ziziphus jujuba var. spinosa]|uniref:Uncharacterized protein n=1 Tax=Ziziphus jujuba var. spinosa TaxID=714518 RepID=A0A978V9U2_ZIZJJ|nr:hypothetical protein FEM48_Zijuj06G0145000 [Ziziphus jujuba var. spinosa]
MEEHKMRYLGDYLQWTHESLESYIKIVKESEPRLRSCYAETIGFSSDGFVKIILVDSASIIDVLLRFSIPEFQDEHERIFNKPFMLQDVRPELLLLENQLPFFILEELCKPDKITLPSGCSENLSMIELSRKFFTKFLPLEGTEEKLEEIERANVAHFVDFLRKWYIPSKPRNGGKCKCLTAPGMTELHRAGVNETELILGNLIAFEQCHCDDNYLNDYVIIMYRLVSTPTDMDLLVRHGIVVNGIGDSGGGATLINKFVDVVIINSYAFYFADICEEQNVFCRSFRYILKAIWLSWKKNLKEKYFNTPWAVMSVIVATLLLVLTIIQTVCSII